MKMKKRLMKKILITMLSTSLMLANCGITSYAASSASGNIDGTPCSASITTNSSGATASTTYSRNAEIKATATVYYWFGTYYYYSTASNSSTAGGTSATASKKLGGSEVVGGKGSHYIKYEAYTWSPSTSIGTIPSSAVGM